MTLHFAGHNRSISLPAVTISRNSSRSRIVPATNANPPDMTSIFELMSVQSPRPFYSKNFEHSYTEQPAYRIATWNMEQLTAEKITNLGVLEVITRTILENG